MIDVNMVQKMSSENYVKLPCSIVKPVDIHAYIGCVAMEFNTLEYCMQLLLGSAGGMDRFTAASVWNSLMFNSRLEVIDKLFIAHTKWRSLHNYWRKLKDFLSEVGSQRNFIVHGIVKCCTENNGTLIHTIVCNDFLTVNDANIGGLISRRNDELNIEQIIEIIRDIKAAVLSVNQLQRWMIKEDKIPEDIDNFQVRYRASLGDRKNPNNPAYEGRK